MANKNVTKSGAARKLETPKQLERLVDDYFDLMEERGEFPDEPGMLNYIEDKVKRGMDVEDFIESCVKADVVGEKAANEFQRVLNRAVRRRNSWLQRACVRDPKGANGYKMLMIQLENGGLAEKNIGSNKERKLKIEATGVGGKSAFQ